MVTGETCLQGILFSTPTWLHVSVGKNVLLLTSLLWWSGGFKIEG